MINKSQIEIAEKATSQILAAYIVAYRVLGFDKPFALWCMGELLRRRESGEDFNFEDYIEEKVKECQKKDDENKQSVI